MTTNAEAVRRHYGAWATTYGRPDDEGAFRFVRARENRLVEECLALSGGESILDAGCGPGITARALKQRGHEVWAVDFSPEMVAQVEGAVDRALVGDVQSLDLGRAFDRVLCIGVLEFVDDAAAAFARLRAHLAPGGRLVVLAPRTGAGGWLYRRTKARHGIDARLYSVGDLHALGTAAGLRFVTHRVPFLHNVIAVFTDGG